MATKLDLPNANVVGSGNLTSEMAQYNYLYSLVPRSTSGDITYTSASSGITYSTATYSAGKYANQGQNGMLSILGEILASYVPTATDFNNKVNVQDFSYLVDTSATPNQITGTITGFTAYTVGSVLKIKAANTNTGVTTVNVTSLGTQTLKKFTNSGISDLTSGDMPAGMVFFAVYDGTNYITNLGLASHLVETSPHSELTNKTVYVATTGSDVTGDGTSVKPFATVNNALSTIKKNVQATITITLADGTYNEDILVVGFYGWSSISIQSTSGVAANCIVKSVTTLGCTCVVNIFNLTLNTTTTTCILVNHSSYVDMTGCVIITSASQYGIDIISGSTGYINACTISNRNIAIHCGNSRIYSNGNSGSGNTTGLNVVDAGTIGKYGTQPGGTTAESAYAGGVIR